MTSRFAVGEGSVEVELGVVNLADDPMPAGLGLHPWFVEPSGRTQPMVELLQRQSLDDAHVAFQLPGSPMDEATESLRACGAWVTPIAPYEWTWPEDLAPAKRLLRSIAERRVSAVTFTSPGPSTAMMERITTRNGKDCQASTIL